MIDFFTFLYSAIPVKSNRLNRLRFYSMCRGAVKVTANFALPVFLKFNRKELTANLNKNSGSATRYIVSLTSFPKRIDKVWLVIESLFRQRFKPDKIILWLSQEQFPSLEVLPESLLEQQNRGLTISLVDEDLRSHKKYYYALKEFPDDCIITVDDDVFYHSSLLETLVKCHRDNPDLICANHVKKIVYEAGIPLPCNKWPHLKEPYCAERKNIQIGIGGVLYPPRSFHQDVSDKKRLLQLAPSADDLWLNAMARLKGKQVVRTAYGLDYLPVLNKEDSTLTAVNVGQGMNDVQLNNIRNYYLAAIRKDPFY